MSETRPATRLLNRQSVLQFVIERGSVTRSALAEGTGLSKPTVSDIVHELVSEGWLLEDGVARGAVGRTPALYRVNADAGRAIGIDLGGTKVRAAICDLNGVLLDEVVEPTDVRGGAHVVEQIAAIARRLAGDHWHLVHHIAVGSPGVLDPATGRMDLAFNIPTFGDVHLRSDLAEALGIEVLVENDVNMAALGERWHGHAGGVNDFVFVALGTGLGMGIVADGELRRGRRGAAGEIAYLPLGVDPLDPENIHRGPLEEAVKGSAIVRRYREAAAGESATDLKDVPGIFAAADAGDPTASRVVRAVARDVALGITAVVAVVDPELVVLGGGIGANPAFARHVTEVLPSVTDQAPKVMLSKLEHRASLVGAVAVALKATHQRLFVAGDLPEPWRLTPRGMERSRPTTTPAKGA